MSALEWAVLPEQGSRTGPIPCPSRAAAERTVIASRMRPGAMTVALVCRVPQEEWHSAANATVVGLLERIAALKHERDVALEHLATWEGAL
ncbi:hypothetical protein [Streptomyces sp. DH37]|uniref:hypothetical protein n=1 Tax=Streptomyces sp. DH37 TaxID=3040122 RepID=UPI0024418DCE|nr:hypothetical protein [Streptomyces sp. DH37]MDG9703739.1 hypothetical protein [Streptomyces sp. DH37]